MNHALHQHPSRAFLENVGRLAADTVAGTQAVVSVRYSNWRPVGAGAIEIDVPRSLVARLVIRSEGGVADICHVFALDALAVAVDADGLILGACRAMATRLAALGAA